jgi:putative transposase
MTTDDKEVPTSSMTLKSHPGWHSRGYLPHLDRPGLIQVITFRLADSLPASVLERIKTDAALAHDQERVLNIERQLDFCHGACHLREPAVAAMVQEALLHFSGQRYEVMAWVIMPNHVHVIIAVWEGWPLSKVVPSWKSYTAHAANKLLHKQGDFWAREYFDRFIRDAEHYEHSVYYIHNNPVKAGLVSRPEEWPYSSAYRSET